MEEACNDKESSESDCSPKNQENSFVITSSNWEIDNNKNFDECISTVSLLQAPDRTNLEDVVSLNTCVALKSDPSNESCKLEFKLTNKQKIARIALVSEASVLEFFKQCGEYATTVFAEFVDEFQDHAVYFAEAKIEPPSTEAGIKFTRTKNKGTTMWIYGIKLILTETAPEVSKSMFDLDVINHFLSKSSQLKPDRAEMARRVLESFSANEHNISGDSMNTCLQKLATMNWNSGRFQENSRGNGVQHDSQNSTECNGDSTSQGSLDLKTYIDDKLTDLEKRLMERIEMMDQKTNQKLDAILKQLELNIDKQ